MALAQELERIGKERLDASRRAERDTRIATIKALLGCIFWCAVGMTFLFFAFYTGDAQTGWVYFWAGLTIGYAGMIWTLAWYYRSGVERGDWE